MGSRESEGTSLRKTPCSLTSGPGLRCDDKHGTKRRLRRQPVGAWPPGEDKPLTQASASPPATWDRRSAHLEDTIPGYAHVRTSKITFVKLHTTSRSRCSPSARPLHMFPCGSPHVLMACLASPSRQLLCTLPLPAVQGAALSTPPGHPRALQPWSGRDPSRAGAGAGVTLGPLTTPGSVVCPSSLPPPCRG